MVLKSLRNIDVRNFDFFRNIYSRANGFVCRKYSQHPEPKSKPTMDELANQLAKKRGIEPGYTPDPPSRAHLSKYLPEKQSDLPPRSMKDSYTVGFIPLSSDKRLQDKYSTFLGSVRVGRLLEDMDIFAVLVADKHIVNPQLPEGVPPPETLVTAHVDRIECTDFVRNLKEDIRLSGHVTWTGRSTMEVVVRLAQKREGTWKKITNALFLIAARDPTNSKAAVVNTIAPTSQKEKEILERSEKRKVYREAMIKQHVFKTPPNAEEQKIIHDLYLKTKSFKEGSMESVVLPQGGVWMEDCKMSNTIVSQVENRNLHNTVFGGFIMRQAAELSWVLGCKFSKRRPKVKTISDIHFKKPIAVNSIITMDAYVVFTQSQFIQITVFVEVFLHKTGVTETTNVFHFTYEVPKAVRQIYPKSYHEAMMYVDGRRHFMAIMKPTLPEQRSFRDEEGIIQKVK